MKADHGRRPLAAGNSLRPDGTPRWPITRADWPSLGTQPSGYERRIAELKLARRVQGARECGA